MELTEPIDSINRQLADLYGIDTVTGLPIWRIVWSQDQFEKRLGTYDDYSPGGIYLRTVTEVRLVPRYRQWIKEKYVLERLSVIPEINQGELPTSALSYEPIYVFEDKNRNYLPPTILASKFAIDVVNAAMGKGSLAKYVDPDVGKSNEENIDIANKRVDAIEHELFGDETAIGDALQYGTGIVVPTNYKERN